MDLLRRSRARRRTSRRHRRERPGGTIDRHRPAVDQRRGLLRRLQGGNGRVPGRRHRRDPGLQPAADRRGNPAAPAPACWRSGDWARRASRTRSSPQPRDWSCIWMRPGRKATITATCPCGTTALGPRPRHEADGRGRGCPNAWTTLLGGLPAIRFRHGQYLQGPAVLAEGDDSFTIVGALAPRPPERLAGDLRAEFAAETGRASCGSLGAGQRDSRTYAGRAQLRRRRAAGQRSGRLVRARRLARCGRPFRRYDRGTLRRRRPDRRRMAARRAVPASSSPFLHRRRLLRRRKAGRRRFRERSTTSPSGIAPDAARRSSRLSGGEEHVARRDLEILGPPQQSLQYWKPRGKAYAGDCMVTCKDGEFHLFYLYDRLHHAAKWGLGAHQYGHFSSTDLKHWTHHPLAVPIDRQWECAMGTGNVIYNEKDRKWYAFYTDCGSRIQFFDKPQRGAWLFRSVSDDGIHFQKDFKPVLPGFDSDIFYVPETRAVPLDRRGRTDALSIGRPGRMDRRPRQRVPQDGRTRQPESHLSRHARLERLVLLHGRFEPDLQVAAVRWDRGKRFPRTPSTACSFPRCTNSRRDGRWPPAGSLSRAGAAISWSANWCSRPTAIWV